MSDTRVARLTLTASDEEHVRRGALLVEDAMRIATLPAAARHRMYIVRHLDIGVIDPTASTQTLALQIERRLEHVQLMAVPATTTSAATASAVCFADEPTAIVELARRLVHGRPVEWFWRHVAHGAVTAATLKDALHACIVAAARSTAGALAVAAVLDAVESVREGAILGALDEHTAITWLRELFGYASLEGPPLAMPGALAALPPRWRRRLVRWASRWQADVRTVWLSAVAAIGARGAVSTPEQELTRARALTFEVLVAEPHDETPAPSPLARKISFEPTSSTTRTAPEVANERAAPSPTPLELAGSTAAAGALFLVRPLAALGIAEWLDDHAWTSRVNWAAQLLASIASEYAGEDDPLVRALGDAAITDAPFVAPECWRELLGRRPHRVRVTPSGMRVLEACGRLPLATWRTRAPDAFRDHPVRRGPRAPEAPWAQLAWQRAVARWLRRFACASLGEVVRRPAQISATSTHIDLVMPLDGVDLRIRTAGLDVDPGWVPWLGRVIRFHYREASP